MRGPEELLKSAHEVIDQAVSLTNPLKKRQIAPLLSGGHDSLCAVHVTTQHPVFVNWGGPGKAHQHRHWIKIHSRFRGGSLQIHGMDAGSP
jgi:hypothetical protein